MKRLTAVRRKIASSRRRRVRDRTRRARGRFLAGAAEFTRYVSVEIDGLLFLVPTDDWTMGKLFVRQMRKELQMLPRALAILEAAGCKTARTTFVDAGASIGTTTLAALQAGFFFVLACEPEPTNARLLRANVALNDVHASVRAVEVALTNRAGTALLDSHRGSLNKSRVLVGAAGAPAQTPVEVRAARLDDLAAEGLFDAAAVGFLWLDVEGHEIHVLEGAGCVLERSPPLVMELYPELLRLGGMMATLPGLLARHYTHVADLRSPYQKLVSIGVVSELIDRYDRDQDHTDLLLCRLPVR